ncbi:MAG: electron transfer flavoprotein subunit beta/FixA family protein [Dehalococcoidia bacterium]
MNIIVCVKQVPDPETPISQFKVDEAAKKVLPVQGIPPVISQFDALAVEAALRVRDTLGEAKITVISLGPDSARDVIKHSLAMGADEGVLLSDPAFENGDSYTTALILTAAIKKLSEYDLILCGRQATDWDFGLVGPGIAELLGIPSITITRDVRVENGRVVAERVLLDGFEVVEAALPSLVTISNELGEPRYPQLRQIMTAARKQVPTWTAADLGLEPSQMGAAGAHLVLERLYVPQVESQCEFIEGETPEEMAERLALRLREAKLI